MDISSRNCGLFVCEAERNGRRFSEDMSNRLSRSLCRELACYCVTRVCTMQTCAFVMCLCKRRSLPAISSPHKPHFFVDTPIVSL